VADDNFDINATVRIISEQALKQLSEINGNDLRHSLLSAGSLRKPTIIVCNTRNSALKLQSGALGRSLPHSTQYLWLPIGPAKLAAALSACCTYHHVFAKKTTGKANMVLAGVLKESSSDVAALDGATETSHVVQEKGDHTESSSFREFSLGVKDDDKDEGVASPVSPTDVAGDGNILQVPRSYQPRRSGSEVSEKPSSSSLPTEAQMVRASTAASSSTEVFSLLLVDDNVSQLSKSLSSNSTDNTNQAINLRLLEVFARKGGHAYRTAQNGQEALDVYEQAAKQERSEDSDLQSKLVIKPEVILMDINMPVMNGFEAARAIRRFEIASGCPRAIIVAVTGLGDASAQEEAFASGMDMFLTKPVKMKEMAAMLAKIRGADT
jgi:CheY-like chemotaxis protein